MNSGKARFLLVCALTLSTLAACGGSAAPATSGPAQDVMSTRSQTATATPTAAAVTETPAGDNETGAALAADATAETRLDEHGTADQSWDSASASRIALNGSAIAVDGGGATADGSKVTITAAGTYIFSGALADGQIVVDAADEGIVRLVLNGAAISSSTGAPIYVARAEETAIVLAEGENTISDGDSYVLEDPASDEPNAAIFSKGDLTIEGSGSLTVTGRYNDGIASKDGLVIAGGTISVSAVDDGIRGKDYLVVKAGQITVEAQGDGLKSDNEEDATKGYITIESGVLNITAGGDAITAQTDVTILDGEIALSAGGGSQNIGDEVSAKGIKGLASVNVSGGTFTIDSADDAIHSNKSVTVQGGTFVIATGDDAIHADASIEVNGGDIRVTESYEGIESAVITINGGDIRIVASDDGLNVAGGQDGSGMNRGPGRGGMGGRPGGDAFAASTSYYLYINGGYIAVDADGDGIDVNGAIEMTDGVVLVNGPTRRDNGALDYDVAFKLTGGLLVAVGSAGMAQGPDQSSTQYSVLLNLNSTIPAGTLVHVQTEAGDEILTFAPTKPYQSIAFSSPELAEGATYDVYFGGASTGAASDGLYQGGAYSSGDMAGSFTISSIVTVLGSSAR